MLRCLVVAFCANDLPVVMYAALNSRHLSRFVTQAATVTKEQLLIPPSQDRLVIRMNVPTVVRPKISAAGVWTVRIVSGDIVLAKYALEVRLKRPPG